MPDDLRIGFTREELITKARDWVHNNSVGCTKEWRYVTLGALADFIADLFEQQKPPA